MVARGRSDIQIRPKWMKKTATNDHRGIAFLHNVLPPLGLRQAGFRRVRRQVLRRIRLRIDALGLADHDAYRLRLDSDPDEWRVLDALCRVTISRFYRDRHLFDTLPALVAELPRATALRMWSAGCASGEEPYSVVIALRPMKPLVWATDASEHMVVRARKARYPSGTLRELDPDTRSALFTAEGDDWQLCDEVTRPVQFAVQDVRTAVPETGMHLVLCRNLAVTYFDTPTQHAVLRRLADAMVPGGALVVGGHETLPEGARGFCPWPGRARTYRRV